MDGRGEKTAAKVKWTVLVRQRLLRIRARYEPVFAMVWDKVAPLLKSRRLALGLLMATAVAITCSPVGRYLDRSFFVSPIIGLRPYVGLAPKAHEKLRLIVLDDKSLMKLGRLPTFAEWLEVARQLRALGIKRILLQDIPSLNNEVGNLEDKELVPGLVVGALPSNTFDNVRSGPSAAIPPSRLLRWNEPWEPSLRAFVFSPADEAAAFIDKFGDISLPVDGEIELFFRTSKTSVLPHLGFWASPKVSLGEDGIDVANHGMHWSPNGKIFVDYLSPADLLKAAVPAQAFFSVSRGEVSVVAPSRRIASIIEGGETAILVPQGFTGSRFIETPIGNLPSYFVTASVVNSFISEHFLYRPFYDWIINGAAALLGFLVLSRQKLRQTVVLTIAGISVWLAFCLLSLLFVGWIIPAATVTLIGLMGLIFRLTHHLLSTIAHNLGLQKDLEMGQAVQTLALPSVKSGSAYGWTFEISFQPYGPMSGDWFQIFSSSENAPKKFSVIAIGDVVGKGPSAALITAIISAIWNQFSIRWSNEGVDLRVFVEELNRVIAMSFKGQQYTTLSLVLLEETGVTLLSFAAPPWFSVKTSLPKADVIRSMPSNPIGMELELPGVHMIKIERNKVDVLFVTTDGLIDGGNARREFADRVSEAKFDDRDPGAVLTGIAARIGQRYALPDDATILVVKQTLAADVVLAEAS